MAIFKTSADTGFSATVYHGARGWAAKGNDVYVYRYSQGTQLAGGSCSTRTLLMGYYTVLTGSLRSLQRTHSVLTGFSAPWDLGEVPKGYSRGTRRAVEGGALFITSKRSPRIPRPGQGVLTEYPVGFSPLGLRRALRAGTASTLRVLSSLPSSTLKLRPRTVQVQRHGGPSPAKSGASPPLSTA